MQNATREIEHLEDSIANVQGVLDNAQRVLAVAEKTAMHAQDVTVSIRRAVFVLAAGGAAIIVIAALRRAR